MDSTGSADALRLLRESAAQISAEDAQATISEAVPGGPQQAFTSQTWDKAPTAPPPKAPCGQRADPYFKDLIEQEEYLQKVLTGEEGTPWQPNSECEDPPGLANKAGGHEDAAQVRRSPLFSCCVVGNGPEPLCSGQPQFLHSCSV